MHAESVDSRRHELGLRELPDVASRICDSLQASSRLVAHLTIVHDVATRLTEQLCDAWPELVIDLNAVHLGSALHDIGKAIVHEELHTPGSCHETAGERILLEAGLDPMLASMAKNHGHCWSDDTPRLEDLCVALADKCWKGKRHAELETAVVESLAQVVGQESWEVFSTVDQIITGLATHSDERLSWQATFT